MNLKTLPEGIVIADLQGPWPKFVENFGSSFGRIGFGVIVGHGLDMRLVKDAREASMEFFRQPYAVRRKYETPENGRMTGYTSPFIETAEGYAVPDLKHFYQVRRKSRWTNPWPVEVPQFERAIYRLFNELDILSHFPASALSEYLGFENGFLLSQIADGDSAGRAIHYFPMNDIVKMWEELPSDMKIGAPLKLLLDEGLRSEQHTDINDFTLLVSSSASGLQVMNRVGEWVPMNNPDGAIVVNGGDMFNLYTRSYCPGKIIPSTKHRVVNPDDRDAERFSFPFFVHPHDEVVLQETPVRKTSREFLLERLRAIGLLG